MLKGHTYQTRPNPYYLTLKTHLFWVSNLQLPQFETFFKASLSKGYYSTNQSSTTHYYSSCPYDDPFDDQEAASKAEILFRSYWRRAWIVLLWLVICISLFTWKFMQYRHRAAFQVMGYCLSTAKGAAETLKLNMALILLPVCRNTITWLRIHPRINSVVPFNDNINFHKVIGISVKNIVCRTINHKILVMLTVYVMVNRIGSSVCY